MFHVKHEMKFILKKYFFKSSPEDMFIDFFFERERERDRQTDSQSVSLRTYHPECARSRLILEAKQGRACLELWWEKHTKALQNYITHD